MLERHQRVARFLQLAGIQAEQLLEETEKLEHMSSPETLRCLDLLVDFFDQMQRQKRGWKHLRSKAHHQREYTSQTNEMKINEAMNLPG